MNVSGSFRDPAGQVFSHEGVVLREVRRPYIDEYDQLMASGLHQELVKDGLLVDHEELTDFPPLSTETYKILKPQQIPFISYPYEWSFNQLKQAALTTLRIEQKALEFGMSLKDASAFNVQFMNGRPIHIDTLSLQKYQEGDPWFAYKQFCQHFLGPLALMRYKGIWSGSLSLTHLDGIPLDLVSSLLPLKSRLKPSIHIHIHLHSKLLSKYAGRSVSARKRKFGKMSHLGLLDNLLVTVQGLRWKPNKSVWQRYYEGDSYTPEAFEDKTRLIKEFLDLVRPKTVWDLGANTGFFSRLASETGATTVAFDSDPSVVDACFLAAQKQSDTNLLPLVMDLASPSPAIGWANQERMDLVQRGPADLVMALALIHHLSIADNVPFNMIAEYLKSLGSWVVVEFVPKTDPKVMLLLESRQDVFQDYTQERFEREFSALFEIKSKAQIEGSERVLYLLKSRM